MGLLSGSVNLSHLASTRVGRNGIILPIISYKERPLTSKQKKKNCQNESIEVSTIENESSRRR